MGEAWAAAAKRVLLEDGEWEVDRMLWVEGEVIVAEVMAELRDDPSELVVKRGLLRPSPFT